VITEWQSNHTSGLDRDEENPQNIDGQGFKKAVMQRREY
jgi:hypothetical protein